jgi:hypothetical protein
VRSTWSPRTDPALLAGDTAHLLGRDGVARPCRAGHPAANPLEFAPNSLAGGNTRRAGQLSDRTRHPLATIINILLALDSAYNKVSQATLSPPTSSSPGQCRQLKLLPSAACHFP